MDEFELMEYVMDQYSGTPEEFGALLNDATMTIHYWERDNQKLRDRKTFARNIIRSLDKGQEMLNAEEKMLRG